MAKTWKIHPTAMQFQRISGDELKELKADIEANGIKVPILVNKKRDTILDGRNRMMIASELLPLVPCHAFVAVLHGFAAQSFVLLPLNVIVPATSRTALPV